MITLGLDTSTTTASVALIGDGRLILEEVRRGSAKGNDPTALIPRANHAETLLPLVENLLKNSSCSWEQISALAVSIGPGSFTGLRIGLSTVKGLAYGWDVPVIGVPTLLAVAARVTDWNGLMISSLSFGARVLDEPRYRQTAEVAAQFILKNLFESVSNKENWNKSRI